MFSQVVCFNKLPLVVTLIASNSANTGELTVALLVNCTGIYFIISLIFVKFDISHQHTKTSYVLYYIITIPYILACTNLRVFQTH